VVSDVASVTSWSQAALRYSLTCRALGLMVLGLRGEPAKDVELLVLRHQVAVLRHLVPGGGAAPVGRPPGASASRQGAAGRAIPTAPAGAMGRFRASRHGGYARGERAAALTPEVLTCDTSTSKS
jgi:hypothetical protein